MNRQKCIGAILITLIAGSSVVAGEPSWGEPARPSILQSWHPQGGWNPYGGGLLRWWPRHCFPCCGAPDDYCRKPLPRVCWPPYPSYYQWGPPEICCPQGNGCRDCNPMNGSK